MFGSLACPRAGGRAAFNRAVRTRGRARDTIDRGVGRDTVTLDGPDQVGSRESVTR
jgi:hypothetical protein